MRKFFIGFIFLVLIINIYTKSFSQLVLIKPSGEIVAGGDNLPKGYTWSHRGDLNLPNGKRISQNGYVELASEYLSEPLDYDAKNFTLVMPDGNLIVYNSEKDNDIFQYDLNDNQLYMVDTAEPILFTENQNNNINLSSLDGCWKIERVFYYTNHDNPYFTPSKICFNKKGKGKFYAYPQGAECEFDAKASLKNNTLTITTSNGQCDPKSRTLMPRTIICEKPAAGYRRSSCIIITQNRSETYKFETPILKIADSSIYELTLLDLDALKKMAEDGDEDAQVELGSRYYSGKDAPKDYESARKWFELAAGKNNATAQNKLGNIFHEAKGVEKDCDSAIEWYIKAAEQGNKFAQFNLGNCYLNDKSNEIDRKIAVSWIRRSCESGFDAACKQLRSLTK